MNPAWREWLNTHLGDVNNNTPIKMIPFIPCPFTNNLPLLAVPDDFTAQGAPLPRPFASNPAKFIQVVKYQSGLLLLKMNRTLVNGPRSTAGFESWQSSWQESLELGISIATIRQVFPGMPQEVDDATKSVKKRMDIAIAWLFHRAIFDINEVAAEMRAYMRDAGGSQ